MTGPLAEFIEEKTSAIRAEAEEEERKLKEELAEKERKLQAMTEDMKRKIREEADKAVGERGMTVDTEESILWMLRDGIPDQKISLYSGVSEEGIKKIRVGCIDKRLATLLWERREVLEMIIRYLEKEPERNKSKLAVVKSWKENLEIGKYEE